MEKMIIIGIVCAVLLFGCAGQSPPPAQNAPAPAPQQAPPSAANNPAPAITPPPAPANAASDDLGALVGLSAGAQYKVDYTISLGGITLNMTGYAKGNLKRTDTSLMGSVSRSYTLADGDYTCSSLQAGWSCRKRTSNVPSISVVQNIDQESLSNYTITAEPDRQVAGVTAKCFKLVGNGATMDYCLSQEGAPLYLSSTTTGSNGSPQTVEMTATSYSTQVADSDFELPSQAS